MVNGNALPAGRQVARQVFFIELLTVLYIREVRVLTKLNSTVGVQITVSITLLYQLFKHNTLGSECNMFGYCAPSIEMCRFFLRKEHF